MGKRLLSSLKTSKGGITRAMTRRMAFEPASMAAIILGPEDDRGVIFSFARLESFPNTTSPQGDFPHREATTIFRSSRASPAGSLAVQSDTRSLQRIVSVDLGTRIRVNLGSTGSRQAAAEARFADIHRPGVRSHAQFSRPPSHPTVPDYSRATFHRTRPENSARLNSRESPAVS